MSRVLVISPHPDDEAIGCGGTLRKHVLNGDVVRVIFLTSGEKGGHGRGAQEVREVRRAEAMAAAKILGVKKIEFWNYLDGACRANRALVEQLRQLLNSWKPAYIYVPHEHEQHPDHRAALRALQKALSNTRNCARPTVRMFEVWTPLQRMDHIEDITGEIDQKIAAIRTYKSQCAVVGFAEAFRGLARYRGEMHCWPEGEYAEVFAELRGGKS